MLRDGLLESWEEPIDPAEDPFDAGYTPPAHELNAEQESVLKAIRARFELGEFGVQLAARRDRQRKDRSVFARGAGHAGARKNGDRSGAGNCADSVDRPPVPRVVRRTFEGVAVLHSALSDVERAREWWRVRNGEARVVVGTRSAVFAPLENLGLIIVDEEQETSYKQEETPRYHGRDVAIVRAKLESAAALLGSATPSLETLSSRAQRKIRTADAGFARGGTVRWRGGDCGPARGFQQTHQTSPISSALHEGIAGMPGQSERRRWC